MALIPAEGQALTAMMFAFGHVRGLTACLGPLQGLRWRRRATGLREDGPMTTAASPEHGVEEVVNCGVEMLVGVAHSSLRSGRLPSVRVVRPTNFSVT